MILHFFCVQIKKKKKSYQPTDPPDFQAKRANRPFIFLGLMKYILYTKGCKALKDSKWLLPLFYRPNEGLRWVLQIIHILSLHTPQLLCGNVQSSCWELNMHTPPKHRHSVKTSLSWLGRKIIEMCVISKCKALISCIGSLYYLKTTM